MTSGATGISIKVHMGLGRLALERRDRGLLAKGMGDQNRQMSILFRRASRHLGQDVLVASPPERQVAFIREQRATLRINSLITYPTNAAVLSEHRLENQECMAFMERMVLQSESLSAFEKKLINEAFPGTGVHCSYSAAELGVIGLRCPHDPCLLLCAGAQAGGGDSGRSGPALSRDIWVG